MLLVFLQFKEFELYLGAVFFRLEDEYRRSPLLINFLQWFLKREIKRVHKSGVILVLNNSEERVENRVLFVHTAVFERARNWFEKIFYQSERNFFCWRAAFKKQFFAKFWWLWGVWLEYCISFRLVLIGIEGSN